MIHNRLLVVYGGFRAVQTRVRRQRDEKVCTNTLCVEIQTAFIRGEGEASFRLLFSFCRVVFRTTYIIERFHRTATLAFDVALFAIVADR